MIKEIQFENYRIFATAQRLKIAPITVIFGKNNTGKSAILKLPLLIETALTTSSGEVFDKFVNGLELCDMWRDVVYGKATKAVTLTLKSDSGDELKVSFYVDDTPQMNRATHIEKWSLQSADNQIMNVALNGDNVLCDDAGREVSFCGIRPSNVEQHPWIGDALMRFRTQVEYLAPIRQAPARDYRVQSQPSDRMSMRGENAYDFLIDDVTRQEGKLLDKVSGWYQQNFDDWAIAIDQSHAPVYYIEMQHNKSPYNRLLKNNILDTGTGIVQSLPVIISAARPTRSSRLSIYEEPETHLHPDAHANMAEFMAEQVAEDSLKRMLIETHSANFIMRLRSMIAEGKLPQESVALYYVAFESNEASSVLKQVTIHADGRVSDWPVGVFGESLQESIRLRNAQIKQPLR